MYVFVNAFLLFTKRDQNQCFQILTSKVHKNSCLSIITIWSEIISSPGRAQHEAVTNTMSQIGDGCNMARRQNFPSKATLKNDPDYFLEINKQVLIGEQVIKQ